MHAKFFVKNEVKIDKTWIRDPVACLHRVQAYIRSNFRSSQHLRVSFDMQWITLQVV